MKKKNGFVFVETIITIVFVAAALLVLFGIYRSAITEEKRRIYYDDMGYLYRNYYIADFLINESEINEYKNEILGDKYAIQINAETNKLFNDRQKAEGKPEELKSIIEEFNVNEMMIVSKEIVENCYSKENKEKCEKSYEGLNEGSKKYLESIDITDEYDYYLVTEYREKATKEGIEKCEENEEDCAVFYVTLGLDINRDRCSIEEKEGQIHYYGLKGKEISAEDYEKECPTNTIGKICEGQKFSECLKDNYEVENTEESGLYYHEGDGKDSGSSNEAGDLSYRYSGANPKNWVCYGSEAEKCPEENLYRIIGIYDKEIKIIKNKENTSPKENKWEEVDKISWKENYIQSQAEEWRNMISESSWQTEGINYKSTTPELLIGNAKEVYEQESQGSKKTSKVGLMYVNEYLYGASPKYWQEEGTKYSEEAAKNNWLYQNKTEWSVSKEKGSSNSYVINEAGNVGVLGQQESKKIRPVINLKETVMLVGGQGTAENPYRLGDIGVVIKNLNLRAEYERITANVEATTPAPAKINKYYYRINGGAWQESTNSQNIFNSLVADTEYTIEVYATNNRGMRSDIKSTKVWTKYQMPNIAMEMKDTAGKVIGEGQWANKNITATAKTSNGKGKYNTYMCYSNTSCNASTIQNSIGVSQEGEGNVCIKTVMVNSKNETSKCFKVKLDKTNPTCTLIVNETGVSFNTKNDTGGSGLKQNGINKSVTPEYTNQSLALSNATYYGHVKDDAENVGICKATISSTSKKYTRTTQKCTSIASKYTCSKNAKATSSCPSTKVTYNDKCYTNYAKPNAGLQNCEKNCSEQCTALSAGYICTSNGSKKTTTYTCFSGKLDGKKCYKYKQNSCPKGWSSSVSDYDYKMSPSTKTVSSCSTGKKVTCNKDHVGDSYVSKCKLDSATCATGLTKLNNDYCYKLS